MSGPTLHRALRRRLVVAASRPTAETLPWLCAPTNRTSRQLVVLRCGLACPLHCAGAREKFFGARSLIA